MVIKCNLKFYGIISDIVKKDKDVAEFHGEIPTLNHIRGVLEKIHPNIKQATYVFAVNQIITNDFTMELKDNDEIALLPAFSGG